MRYASATMTWRPPPSSRPGLTRPNVGCGFCPRSLAGSDVRDKEEEMVASVEFLAAGIRNGLAGTKSPLYRACMLLAISLASVSAIAWSQTQLATIFGAITDPSGAVIPVAAVTILNQNTG